MVTLVNRWALVAAAAGFSLVLGAAPAAAFDNAPVANSSESAAITKVEVTFADSRGTCTGTALSPTQILTAQHCIDSATNVEVVGYSGDRIPVASTIVDIYNGHDVAFLNLAGSWRGPTLPMNPTRPNTGDELEFYGMGDGEALHVTTGRVSGFANDSGRYVREASNGSVLLARLQPGVSAEHGDSGGPVIHDGEIVGVILGALRDNQREVIATPLSSVRKFLDSADHAGLVNAVPLPAQELLQYPVANSAPQLLEDAAVAEPNLFEAGSSAAEAAAPPTDIAMAAIVAVLLALGIHAGALDIPALPLS